MVVRCRVRLNEMATTAFSPSADAVAGTRRRTRFCFTRFGCMRSFLQSTFTAVFNRAQDTGKLASRVLYVG